MYLSCLDVYNTVTLIYQTFLKRNNKALGGQDNILDVITLPNIPTVVLELLRKVFLFI